MTPSKKSFLFVSLSALLCVSCFVGGYITGGERSKASYDTDISETDALKSEAEISTPAAENEIIESNDAAEEFMLKNENGILKLYSITESGGTVVKSVPFNSSFLPSGDRIKLEKGIILDTLEEGFSLIEDFTS